MIEIYPLTDQNSDDFTAYSKLRADYRDIVMIAMGKGKIVGYSMAKIEKGKGVFTAFVLERAYEEFTELLWKSMVRAHELREIQDYIVKDERMFDLAEKMGLRKEKENYYGHIDDRFCGGVKNPN